MKKEDKNLGVEIIMILCVLIASILLLSKAFTLAASTSKKASRLSDAVTLASDCADVYLSSDTIQEVYAILNKENNATFSDRLSVFYDEDLKASFDGPFKVVIETNKQGNFETAQIAVFYKEEAVYTIETGKEVKP